MTAIFLICVTLFILSVWRRFHHQLAEKKFKYRMFALRDRLRRMAIEEKIDCNHWYFRYMDRSFSHSIRDAYFLTLFRILWAGSKMKYEKSFVDFMRKLRVAEEEHPEVRQLLVQYQRDLHEYLVDQHYIGYTIFIKPLVSLFIGARKGQRKLTEAMKATLYVPKEDQNSHLLPI